jgi:hypothetical protein
MRPDRIVAIPARQDPMTRPPLTRHDYYLGPRRLGDLWTLARAPLTMKCSLSTHKLGWELKLTAGASFSRVQVCRSETEVYDTADKWKAEAMAQGWS